MKPRLLPLCILAILAPAHTALALPESADSLDRVVVRGTKTPPQSANQNVKTVDAAQLEEEMSNSLEDAIRYLPGVEINDMGQRFGDNGVTIRGLSGDRVAMSVDGLALPEQVESIGSSLYDFFRTGRGSPDIDNLKQLEIVKGADSITAGSGALGGSVAFITKDAADYLTPGSNDTYAAVKLGHASVNAESHGSLTLANRTGKLESVLVYTQRQGHETEGWYSDSPARIGISRRIRDPLDFDSRSLLAKVHYVFRPGHRLGFNVELNRGETRIENLSRIFGPASPYIERWGDDEVRRHRYGLHWEWAGDTRAFDTLELRLDRQKSQTLAHTRIYGLSASCAQRPVACWRLDDRSSEQVQNQVTLDFDKRLEGRTSHALSYGLAWQSGEMHQVDYRSFYETSGSITRDPFLQGGRLPDVDRRHWTLYLRDRIRLMDERLGITLGARYDNYRYQATPSRYFQDRAGVLNQAATFAAPSWSAGLDWALTDTQTLWLQTGRGFRAPSASNMFLNLRSTEATNIATGETVYFWNQASNPDLEAEKSRNIELGWRWGSERARWGVSVFRDTYDNLIDVGDALRTPDITYQLCEGTPPTCRIEVGNRYTTYMNLGKATIRGYELEGMVQLGEPWLLRATWSQNRGEMANGRPIDTINPAKGVVGLTWLSPAKHWRINATLTHTQAKKAGDLANGRLNTFTRQFNRPLSDAWSTLDMSVNWQPDRHWRVNAGVYNLFDRRYTVWPRLANVVLANSPLHGGVDEEGLGRYTAPGRNFRATVSYSF